MSPAAQTQRASSHASLAACAATAAAPDTSEGDLAVLFGEALRFEVRALDGSGRGRPRTRTPVSGDDPLSVTSFLVYQSDKTEAAIVSELRSLMDRGVVLQAHWVSRAFPKKDGKARTPENVTELILNAKARSESPERRKVALVVDTGRPVRTCKKNPTTSLPMTLDEGGFIEAPMNLPGDAKHTKPQPQVFPVPTWMGPNICNHLMKADRTAADKAMNGTGHARASDDQNAFPRTWSTQKILEAIRVAGTQLRGKEFPRDADGGFKATGTYLGLTISLYLRRDKTSGKDFLVSAYVDNTSWAGRAENKDVDAANVLLEEIRDTCKNDQQVTETFARMFAEENIWATIATAESLKELLAGAKPSQAGNRAMSSSGVDGKSGGGGKDKAVDIGKNMRALDYLLCLGGTRHPSHVMHIAAAKRMRRDQMPQRTAPAAFSASS